MMDITKIEDPEVRKNLQMMITRHEELLSEQATVKERGYQINDYCFGCSLKFDRLEYRICSNGYISYWCDYCLKLRDGM